LSGRVCDRIVRCVTVTGSEGELFEPDLVQVGSYHVRKIGDVGRRERCLDEDYRDDEVLRESNCGVVLKIDCNT
jgi:hypothetical protein